MMKLYCPKKDGVLWVRLMGRTKAECREFLRDDLSWTNCFDTLFRPTKKQLDAFEIVEVEIVEKQS